MNALHAVWARVLEMFRLRRLDRELNEEVQHHLDALTDDFVRRGLSRVDARAAARREFGGVDAAVEAVRDRRGFRALDTVRRDVRHAFRLLAKAPGFTFTAVLTLALGFGANTAIFSLVDGVVLRPLPYSAASRLVAVWETPLPGSGAAASDRRMAVAPANLADYRQARSIEHLAAYAPITLSLTGSGRPERLAGESVTAEYFDALGAHAALGRVVRTAENQTGAPLTIVLSHGLWRERFGSDPGVLGRTVTLDQHTYEIVGVMGPDFRAVSALGRPDAGRYWIPISFDAELLANRDDHEVQVVARLAPGATVAGARADLSRISSAILATRPAGRGSGVALAPLGDDVSHDASPMLVALLGGVGFILLIACVNVANLLIVRSLTRHREIAVRLALGASRGRIVSELVTQSLVLSTLGLVAGVALAGTTMKWLLALAPTTIPRLDAVTIDGRVLFVTGATSLVVGLVFGLLPLRQVTRSQAVDALKVSERVVGGTWVHRWRAALMVVEIAISLTLLVGAGLMVRSLVTLNRVDLGFDPANVLAVGLNLPEARYATPDARLAFFETVAARVAQLPHVRVVTFANRLPLRGGWTSGFGLEPAADVPEPGANTAAGFQAVSPDYFRLFGIRLVTGRLLADTDRNGAEFVAVVNRKFGASFLGNANPIGHRLRRFEKAPWITIVGVVSDIRRDGREGTEDPQVYLSAAQTPLYPPRLSDLAIRTDGPALDLANDVRAAIWSIDPDQTMTGMRTLEDTLALQSGERRFRTTLFGAFGGLALVLALVGVYGVVSYAAWQRRPEIGLRMALGADARAILAWIVGGMARLVLAGIVLGLGLARSLSSLVEGLLFGVARTDLLTYAVSSVALSAAAILTCTLVARTATRIDPTVALKHE